MEYSTVIVTYNKKDALKEAIESIIRQRTKPNEIIIVDNNSTDGTIELLLDYKKVLENFRIYQTKKNIGYCKGVNIGVSLARNSIILIMDHDAILLNENWVDIALKNFRNQIAVAWGNPGVLDGLNYGEFFLGSAFITRKEIFEEVGGFDEKFFIDENEADLVVRLNKKGYRIMPLKTARIHHPYRERDARYYEFALSNRNLIYWKYYSWWIAAIMTMLHSFQELREMKNYRLLKYWIKGLRRFISKLYTIGLSYKERMTLKEFIRHAYQLRFPAFGYKLIKILYRL
ncbi:MAG: glycosyltransferase family 2 protein [Candidatus Helarchaeota archaeon]